jgi:hypothetical protein
MPEAGLCGSVQRLFLCRLIAALPRLLGMLFLPGVDPWVVMVTREDPPEDAEPWLPAPAVRVAVASKETGCLPGAVVHGEGRVTQDQDGEELLHAHEPRSESPKRQGCLSGWPSVRPHATSRPARPGASGPPRSRSAARRGCESRHLTRTTDDVEERPAYRSRGEQRTGHKPGVPRPPPSVERWTRRASTRALPTRHRPNRRGAKSRRRSTRSA